MAEDTPTIPEAVQAVFESWVSPNDAADLSLTTRFNLPGMFVDLHMTWSPNPIDRRHRGMSYAASRPIPLADFKAMERDHREMAAFLRGQFREMRTELAALKTEADREVPPKRTATVKVEGATFRGEPIYYKDKPCPPTATNAPSAERPSRTFVRFPREMAERIVGAAAG